MSIGIRNFEQITRGPRNHLFGYIGHALTIPWNATGRYVVALRTAFHDRMPRPGEVAEIVLIDMREGYRVLPVDRTLAWNLQQGTMLYWNPDAAATQFFFNDLDPDTGVVFTVLYDIEKHARVREYRFGNRSIANGGVAPTGKYFAGVNYGKISRSREIISYAGATDWTAGGAANPETDGLFRVEIATGECELLLSYRQLQDVFLNKPAHRERCGDPDAYPLYVHHTLWNRDGSLIAFMVRGMGNKLPNAHCVVRSDGSGLAEIPFSGHPEWIEGDRMVFAEKNNEGFRIYDTRARNWDGLIGTPGIFPDTKEDNALSPDGRWFVGSHNPTFSECVYTVYRLADGAHGRSPSIHTWRDGGVCRIDPAPRWNRTSDALLVPGLDKDGTRQLFLCRINSTQEEGSHAAR